MREWEGCTIGERDYELKPLGAIKGQQVLTRVLKVLGSASGGITGGDDKDSSEAIAKMLGELDDETVEFLCDAFGNCTRVVQPGGKTPTLVNGANRAVFDEHFAARYGELVEWLAASFRLNYSDFLDASKRERLLTSLGLKKAKSESTSQSTSTGSSGES